MATVRFLGLFPQGCVRSWKDYGYIEAEWEYLYFPLPSLNTAMNIAWRVREWEGTLTSPHRASIASELNSYPKTIQSETGLICNYPKYAGYSIEDPQETENTSIQLGGIKDNFEPFTKEGDIYYARGGLYDWDWGKVAEPTVDNSLTITWSWSKTVEDVVTFSGTATLKPKSWWPYDPGDGLGPIYDSATGAQLRPFPA